MVMNISGPPWVVDIPAGNALALTTAQVQAVQALGYNVLTVGLFGQYPTLSALLAAEASNISAENPAVALFSAGTHDLATTATDIPAGLHLMGVGRTRTTLRANAQYASLRFSGGFPHQLSNFRLIGRRTSDTSGTGLIIVQTAAAHGMSLRDMDIVLNGGFQAAIHCTWFSNVEMSNVDIYTSSIGLRVTGRWRCTDCSIFLHDVGDGITSTTPKIGVITIAGSSAGLRLFYTGGFIGTGYGPYWDSTLVTEELTGAARANTEVVGIWVPSNHTVSIGTGTRFQMRGTEMYTRNDQMTSSSVRNHCILIEGNARVRLFGGLYQSESPAMTSAPPLAVRNLADANGSTVESYAARITYGYEGISAGLGLSPVRRISASVALDQSSASGVIFADASVGPITVTLPAVSNFTGPGNGTDITVVKVDSSGNAITVQRQSATASIEGGASLTLSAQYAKAKLVYDPVAKVYVRLI